MARDITIVPEDDGRVPARPAAGGTEPSLGELFKQLAQDSSTLVRQEMALAKAEMRENLAGMVKGVALLAVGGVALLMAGLALLLFLIYLLGDLLGDEYWLGALIVGVLFAILGAVLLATGRSKMKEADLKPDQTLATLREDKRWAESEVKQVKQDLTS